MSEPGGPPKKKQKMDRTLAMDGPTVGLSRLTKHVVEFTPELSPGALHSNRVAIHVRNQVSNFPCMPNYKFPMPTIFILNSYLFAFFTVSRHHHVNTGLHHSLHSSLPAGKWARFTFPLPAMAYLASVAKAVSTSRAHPAVQYAQYYPK